MKAETRLDTVIDEGGEILGKVQAGEPGMDDFAYYLIVRERVPSMTAPDNKPWITLYSCDTSTLIEHGFLKDIDFVLSYQDDDAQRGASDIVSKMLHDLGMLGPDSDEVITVTLKGRETWFYGDKKAAKMAEKLGIKH